MFLLQSMRVGMLMYEDLKKVYKDLATVKTEDLLELLHSAETEDEKEFYTLILNFTLQMRQKKVISEGIY